MAESNAIELGKGIGELRFGLTMAQVKQALGEPEEVEKSAEDDNFEHQAWNYLDKGYSLYFDQEDDYRLSCIETDRADLMLYGTRIIGRSLKEVRALMAANGYHTASEEALDAGERQLSYESEMIDFYFVDDELVVINFGVFVDQSSLDVKWPQAT